jgi:predicted nucleotidyltransferase
METKLAQSIKDYFANRKEVVAVYLFGSRATGKETDSSDVDIAVLIDPDQLTQNLTAEYIVGLSKTTRKDIHLTLFNRASERLAKQIYTKGHRLLVNNPRQLALFNMTMYARIADFAYYAEHMKHGFVRKLTSEGKQDG